MDVEVGRDKLTGGRRRVSRHVAGTRRDAEAALARLKVAAEHRKVTPGRVTARSVRAALDLYLESADEGTIELAPRTIVTSRSAANTMCSARLLDNRTFGSLPLHRLSWREIEEMYGALRTSGAGADWVRRCATVLTRSLEFARKRGLIDGNPAKDATRPRSTRSKPVSPTLVELREVLEQGRVAEAHQAERLARRTAHQAGRRRPPPAAPDLVRAVRREFDATPPAGAYVFPHPLGPAEPYRPDSFGDRCTKASNPSAVTLLQL